MLSFVLTNNEIITIQRNSLINKCQVIEVYSAGHRKWTRWSTNGSGQPECERVNAREGELHAVTLLDEANGQTAITEALKP